VRYAKRLLPSNARFPDDSGDFQVGNADFPSRNGDFSDDNDGCQSFVDRFRVSSGE
jgi:hypothetical protein